MALAVLCPDTATEHLGRGDSPQIGAADFRSGDPAADVAQVVEQLPCKQQVTSSSLVIGSSCPVPDPVARRARAQGLCRRDTEAVKRGRL